MVNCIIHTQTAVLPSVPDSKLGPTVVRTSLQSTHEPPSSYFTTWK